jgi:DNA-binding MarR family transcriptional regulator
MDSLPYTLWQAQNAVHRLVQEAVDDLGVTVTQLGLAVHLGKLGALSASDMSRGFRITPQSVSTALTRLDALGWVDRKPHPVHGRVVLFTLSETGHEGAREGSARMALVTERISGMLGADRGERLITGLRAVLQGLEGDDRPMEMLWPIRA